jgi:hypothetical protein
MKTVRTAAYQGSTAVPSGGAIMEKIIEQDIKGKGLLTLGSLTEPTAHHEVAYDLDVYQTVVPVLSQGDPNATTGGSKEVRGRIAPVYFTGLTA